MKDATHVLDKNNLATVFETKLAFNCQSLSIVFVGAVDTIVVCRDFTFAEFLRFNFDLKSTDMVYELAT